MILAFQGWCGLRGLLTRLLACANQQRMKVFETGARTMGRRRMIVEGASVFPEYAEKCC